MLVSGVKNCSVHNELVGLCGVEDQVWRTALCQKVQGHFLAPVRPWLQIMLVIKTQVPQLYNISK